MFFSKVLNRINPHLIWYLYAQKCKKTLDKSYFIFSFDCDTKEDIAVAWDVHSKLRDIGVTPVYAVPGALLQKGEKTYRKIKEEGAHFINHGGREHTYFNKTHNRHTSCFFYDQQSYETVREDILLGHQILKDVLGATATGWRTPHFGTFQKKADLKFLYKTLKELNYTFSSSTGPLMAYKYGPLYKTEEVIEIPVTGIYSEPFNILDTWGYFEAPNRQKLPLEYAEECKALENFSTNFPILINIYGDPSHIYDKPDFFKAMKLLVKTTKNINYEELLEIADDKIRHI